MRAGGISDGTSLIILAYFDIHVISRINSVRFEVNFVVCNRVHFAWRPCTVQLRRGSRPLTPGSPWSSRCLYPRLETEGAELSRDHIY